MKHPIKSLVLLLLILSGCNSAPITPAPIAVATKKKEVIKFTDTVVSLTFDDGDVDNYSVRSVLAENNLHATFYVVSGFTNSNGYMTEDQLRDLHNDGNEIGGHTLNHQNLEGMRGAELEREVCRDRSNLLAYGFEATSFAYPYGHYDDEAKHAVRDCGYDNARGVSGGSENIPPDNEYVLRAMPYIESDTRFPKMVRYVTDAEKSWIIFVFHHVCDGCDKYSIKLETFSEFARWLGEQQSNGLVVKTVGEVMGGK